MKQNRMTSQEFFRKKKYHEIEKKRKKENENQHTHVNILSILKEIK